MSVENHVVTLYSLMNRLESGRIEGMVGDRITLLFRPYAGRDEQDTRQVVLCYWGRGGKDCEGQFVVWLYSPATGGYESGQYFDTDRLGAAVDAYHSRGGST